RNSCSQLRRTWNQLVMIALVPATRGDCRTSNPEPDSGREQLGTNLHRQLSARTRSTASSRTKVMSPWVILGDSARRVATSARSGNAPLHGTQERAAPHAGTGRARRAAAVLVPGVKRNL